MHLGGERLAAAVVLTLAALLPAPASARQPPPITAVEVDAAVVAVSRDPNLSSERTMKILRWRDSSTQRSRPDLSWMKWIAGLMAWAMESARYLMWAAIALLVAWIAVYLTRAIRQQRTAAAAEAFVAPTHVRDLDIRPESLPPDIGQAARTLWEAGAHRAALSLLYRGVLSRLSHVHRVPIRDSSTEGDCLALMSDHVTPQTSDYCVRLIGAWQEFVYGGTAAPDAAMHSLCEGFAAALDRSARPPAIERGAP